MTRRLLAEDSWGSVCPRGGKGLRSAPSLLLPGRRDSSGIRLYYTATLRRFDAGIMELGLVYTPVMAIPPQEPAFVLTGYCTDKCTQLVSVGPGLLRLQGWGPRTVACGFDSAPPPAAAMPAPALGAKLPPVPPSPAITGLPLSPHPGQPFYPLPLKYVSGIPVVAQW